jgi:hypothetical protein
MKLTLFVFIDCDARVKWKELVLPEELEINTRIGQARF